MVILATCNFIWHGELKEIVLGNSQYHHYQQRVESDFITHLLRPNTIVGS